MNDTPTRIQFVLTHILQRFCRVWIVLLVGIVCVPITVTVWYLATQYPGTESDDLAISVLTPSDNVAVSTAITISFGRTMATQQLATQLTLSPAVPYALVWNTTHTTVQIIPTTPWHTDTQYTITLRRTATDAHPWWQWRFRTEPGVQIEHVVPADGSDAVARNSLVVARFATAMVPQSAVHRPSANTIFRITPALDGRITWIDQYTALFIPNALTYDTTYTVTIPNHVQDMVGRTLRQPYTWRFRTLAPQLTLVSPRGGAQDVALTAPIVLSATGVFDEQALRASITVWPATPTRIDVTRGDNDTTQITIAPQPAWQIATTYQFAIGGGTSQIAYQQRTFTTAPPLQLVARSPGEGQVVYQNQDVRFIFNTELATQTLTDAITLIPPPITPATITSSGRDIRIQADWVPGVIPEVRIDALLQSSTGITLGRVLTSQLILDNRTRYIAWPQSAADILDASGTTPLIITSQNIENMVVQLYDLAPSTLVHVLGMDANTLHQIVPVRYDLPLIYELSVANPQNEHSFVIPNDVRARATSRLVLAVVSDTQQTRDVRIMRLAAASLQITHVHGYIAVGSTTGDGVPTTVDVLLSGELVEQGQLDDTGIWRSRQYQRGGTFIVRDRTTPHDALRITLPAVTAPMQQVTLISEQMNAIPGTALALALARTSGYQFTQVVPVALCRTDGVLLAQQNVVFQPGQTLTHGILNLPQQLAYGPYHICIRTATIRAEIPLIVHAPLGERLRLQSNRDSTGLTGRLSDAAAHVVADATIYWVQGRHIGTTTTAADGSFRIAVTPHDPVLLVATHQGESRTVVVDALRSREIVLSSPQTWVPAGDFSRLDIQIVDPDQRNLQQRLQVVVRNQAGYVATRQRIQTDATGRARIQLAIPRGMWEVEVSDESVAGRIPLRVGGSSDTLSVATQPQNRREPLQLWVGEQSPSPMLMAQHDATGTTMRWVQPSRGVITTTIPMTSAFVQIALPSQRQLDEIIQDADCISFTVATDVVRTGTIPITITTAPESMLAIRLLDRNNGNTVAWQQSVMSQRDGSVVLQIPDNGTTRMVRLDALVSRPWCSMVHQHDFTIRRAQSLRLDAPTHTRIGDEVVVTLALNDQLAQSQSVVTATITNALILAQPDTQVVTSDNTGTAMLQWRIRITHPNPQFSVQSQRGGQAQWQPVVDVDSYATRDDGFFLAGRTQINRTTPALTIDMLRMHRDLMHALRADRVDAQNPSQLAHLIWLSEHADERTRLLTLLDEMRHGQAGWGWGDGAVPDVLITADVVSALASANVSRTHYQAVLPFLIAQLRNPALPATTRVLSMRALVQSGSPLPPEYLQIGDNLDALGTEGLAAYLDILPAEQAFRIPAIMAVLLERRHTTPRGSYWDEDPATVLLHSRNSVNALLLNAFINVSVNRDIQRALINYLASSRGVAGWGDAISNARLWAMRDSVFASLDGNQQSSVQLHADSMVQNQAIWPALTVTADTILTSDTPVLVGISQVGDASPVRNDMVLYRTYSLLDGTPLTQESIVSVNDYVNGTLDIITFAGMQYLTITDPLIQLGQIEFITPPPGFTVIVDANNRIMLYGNATRAGIWRCQYRIRLTNAGQVSIPAAVAADAAGIIHARSQATTLTIAVP